MSTIGKPPSLIAIDRDDFHAKHIGRLSDGRQFFLTSPFIPADPQMQGGSEFNALFIFDAAGALLEAKIEDFGPRAEMDAELTRESSERWLKDLGQIEFGRIAVQPFAVHRFNTEFGLIPRPLEYDEGEWIVEMQPGNYMAFLAPWDDGEYET